MSAIKRLASAAALAVLLLGPDVALADTTCRATKAHYDALKSGMSYNQAVAVIGCEGEEMSRSEMSGFVTFMVMWNGTSMGGNMNAMFQNDALINKAQFGLK